MAKYLYEDNIKAFAKFRKQIVQAKISVDELIPQKFLFDDFAKGIIHLEGSGVPLDERYQAGLEDFLMICLDVYTYSETGAVLIDDHTYDILMNIWMHHTGGRRLSQSDYIKSKTTWGFVKHQAPFMVGTINAKLYTVDELELKLDEMQRMGARKLFYAPKFDGVSGVVKWDGNHVTFAATRNNGVQGQDITPLIQQMEMARQIFSGRPAGWYKCELVVSTDDYNKLKELKGYANRRSAASAIVSTPGNIDLASYLMAIPLAHVDFEGRHVNYLAREYLRQAGYTGIINEADFDVETVYDTITDILHFIRQPSFAFRVDGVVLFPVATEFDEPNLVDLMANAAAYKVNTQETITHVVRVYMSVGRTGLGKPMAEVQPCDLNETVCTDISLGSMDIFSGLGLHRDEEVIAYAAGDVIPQLRLPDTRNYPRNSPRLKMDIHCPYCGEAMRFKKGSGTDVYCLNPSCPRVRSGKIVNFLEKLEVADGFRDETFYKLVDMRLVQGIKDLFNLKKIQPELSKILGSTNAENLIEACEELRTKEFEISRVIGACGIENIAIRTCQKIFGEYTLGYLMDLPADRAYVRLMALEGVGEVTASTLADWLEQNKEFVKFLLATMNIVEDPVVYATVVFTGFRDPVYEEKFKKTGFPVAPRVTSDTVACVFLGDTTTGKARQAALKKIPLLHYADIDFLLKFLEEEAEYIARQPGTFDRADLIRDLKRRI